MEEHSGLAGESIESQTGSSAVDDEWPCRTCEGDGIDSSRTDKKRAGWREEGGKGDWPALLDERKDPRWTEFSWLAVKSLLDSANDKVAKNVHDLVNARRMRWVRHALVHKHFMHADPWEWAKQQGREDRNGWKASEAPAQAEKAKDFSFLLLGDPGEADPSQYAVVDALASKDDRIDFMLIGSDVIYPAGDVNDYANAFFLPYERWVRGRVPILAIPGNHDWYDGLNGFMFTFCGVDALPPTAYRWTSYTIAERLAKAIWRTSSRPDPTRLLEMRDGNPMENPPKHIPEPVQPGPYFMIDTQYLRIIAIDTGITGTLDREQGEWLRFVSRGPKSKLLVTGKPIYVDNEYNPGQIQWTSEGCLEPTVDDIVRDPDNNYVAAIGCDVHNYQRYCVRLRPRSGDGSDDQNQVDVRRIEYIVAGGSGAYLSATHRIDKIDMNLEKTKNFPQDVFPVTERAFRCYPLRGDSVAYYAWSFGRYLFRRALLSLVVPIVLAVLYLWPDIRLDSKIRDGVHDGFLLWHAVLASLAGIAALALFGALIAGIGRVAPRGYRAFASVLLALTVVGAALWLMDGQEWWGDQWEVVLVTIAVIVAPLVAILVGYYYRGAGPRLTHDVTVVLLAMSMVLLIVEFPVGGDTKELLLQLWIGLGILAIGATALGWIRSHFRTPATRRWYRRVVMVLFAVGMGFLWNRWDEGWLFPTIAIAVGVIACLLFIALWVMVIASRAVAGVVLGGLGWRGVVGRGQEKRVVDPDEAMREVANRYDLDDDHIPRYRAAEKVSSRTKRAVNCLLTDRGQRRRLIDSIVSEVGDANVPPMFKSFLRLNVEGASTGAPHLVIECFGVTGWSEDAEDPPREDCVRIPLLVPDGPTGTASDAKAATTQAA